MDNVLLTIAMPPLAPADDDPKWEIWYPIIAAGHPGKCSLTTGYNTTTLRSKDRALTKAIEWNATAADVKERYAHLRRWAAEVQDFHCISDVQPDTTPR